MGMTELLAWLDRWEQRFKEILIEEHDKAVAEYVDGLSDDEVKAQLAERRKSRTKERLKTARPQARQG